MVRKNDLETPYPRICAHRGFNTVAPENTLPAFAAAIALGAEEIELDVWETVDGELVITHDPTVDRTSDGHGKVWELTYAEMAKMDVGSRFSRHFAGMGFLRFEELLQQFARQVIMNIHVKGGNEGMPTVDEYNPAAFCKLVSLIDQYDCANYIYIAGDDDVMKTALKMAPQLTRCCLAGQLKHTIVDRAIQFGCKKLQFFKPYFNQDMIDQAHANGIHCNIFWADDPGEARHYLDMGIDTILTNDYFAVKTGLGS